jgi:ABC-type nitrate/sulfonate/bicarbonate transport system substrate-binding protein
VTTDFSVRDNVMVRGDVDAATYFHDSAISLFARMPPAELSVLPYASAGPDLYGNAVLASRKLIAEHPQALRGFLRATTRAIKETLAHPEAAMAAIKQREPILDLAVERQRWGITRGYVATAETRSEGLGRRTWRMWAGRSPVTETFGLSSAPTGASLRPVLLPPLAERLVKPDRPAWA